MGIWIIFHGDPKAVSTFRYDSKTDLVVDQEITQGGKKFRITKVYKRKDSHVHTADAVLLYPVPKRD